MTTRQTKKTFQCRVCTAEHPLKRCQKFLTLAPTLQWEAAVRNGYCVNCLAHQHSKGDCLSGKGCKKCGRAHHTLLHVASQYPRHSVRAVCDPSASDVAPSTSAAGLRRPATSITAPTTPRSGDATNPRHSARAVRDPIPSTSTAVDAPASAAAPAKPASEVRRPRTAMIRSGEVPEPTANMMALLPTAVVFVMNSPRETPLRALLDICSVRCRISSALVDELALEPFLVGTHAEVALELLGSNADPFLLTVIAN